MVRLLIDTNILIDVLRNYAPAVQYLDQLFLERADLSCSTITKAELYAGMLPPHELHIEALLKHFKSIQITDDISRQAGAYLRCFKKPHRLMLGDALIAATAYVTSASLVTRNVRDFPMRDIKIIKPFN